MIVLTEVKKNNSNYMLVSCLIFPLVVIFWAQIVQYVFVLQKGAIRLVYGARLTVHYKLLFRKVKVLFLPNLYVSNFKEYIDNFISHSDVHCYNTKFKEGAMQFLNYYNKL